MKKTFLYLFVFILIFLTGCNTDTLPDMYIEESDYQYKQWYRAASFLQVQQGDDIAYFYHNGFIYYLEDGRDVIMPLCNKVDCLHDQETDAEKRAECNAYVDSYEDGGHVSQSNTGIAKCNDYIYCLNSAVSLDAPQTLSRYSLDGTTKEVVYTWNSEESAILEWIVHRDVLYYVEKKYYLKDNEVITENSLKSLALTGFNRQPETIYLADEKLSVLTLGNLQAYGNHMYFMIISKYDEEDENVNLYQKTFVYDIQKRMLNELEIPGLPDSASIKGVKFWQNKIIIDPYDSEKPDDAPTTVYIAELDGSNPQVLLEDIPQVGYFLSDGEYLYFFDDWMPDIDDWLSNPGLYTVYDKDLNIVDAIRAPLMPDGSVKRLPVGEADKMYFIYQDETNGTWGVVRWGKADIGSYQGEAFSLTEIRK